MGRIDTADLRPDPVGVVIIGIYRHIQPVFVDAHPVLACQELPGERNRFLFEIIADGEIAEHFKKSMMPGSLAHVFDVVGPDAFLRIGNPVAGGLLGTIKIFFQSRNTCVDPQQCRIIVRDQRSPWFYHVTFGCKIIQEHLTDLISGELFHVYLLSEKEKAVSGCPG